MAILTWRNVDTPSFKGVGDLYKSSADASNLALEALGKIVSDIKTQQGNTADKQLALNAARYTTPTAAQEGIANNGVFSGVDLQNLTKEGLNSLANLVSNTAKQQEQVVKSNDALSTSERTGVQNTNTDNARTAIADMFANVGNPDRIKEIQAEHYNELSKLTPTQQSELFQTMQLGDSRNLASNQARFNYNVGQRNDADQGAAADLIAQGQNGVIDPTSGLQLLNTAPSNRARVLATPAITALAGGAVGGASALPTVVPGENVPIPTNVGNGNYTVPALIDNATGRPFELPNTPVATTAVNNVVPVVVGKGAKTKQALANAIAPSVTVPTVPVPSVADFRPKTSTVNTVSITPSKANQPVSPAQVNTSIADSAAKNISNIGSLGTAVELQDLRNSKKAAGEVADELISKGGFKDANKNRLIDKINEVAQEANVSPAYAARIIQKSQSSASGIPLPGPNRFLGTSFLGADNLVDSLFGRGVGVNDKEVAKQVEAAKSGLHIEQAVASDDNNLGANQVTILQNAAVQAKSKLDQVVKASQTNPNLASQIPRLQAEYNSLTASLQDALNKQRVTPTRRFAPQAVPKK